mmetsp:Transcript_29079/g.77955  ORF Transcript_29079/g.77955 Transcript_29079/m.77955 type:complete len:367 (-) Transcript_29079:174-1274(-)
MRRVKPVPRPRARPALGRLSLAYGHQPLGDLVHEWRHRELGPLALCVRELERLARLHQSERVGEHALVDCGGEVDAFGAGGGREAIERRTLEVAPRVLAAHRVGEADLHVHHIGAVHPRAVLVAGVDGLLLLAELRAPRRVRVDPVEAALRRNPRQPARRELVREEVDRERLSTKDGALNIARAEVELGRREGLALGHQRRHARLRADVGLAEVAAVRRLLLEARLDEHAELAAARQEIAVVPGPHLEDGARRRALGRRPHDLDPVSITVAPVKLRIVGRAPAHRRLGRRARAVPDHRGHGRQRVLLAFAPQGGWDSAGLHLRREAAVLRRRDLCAAHRGRGRGQGGDARNEPRRGPRHTTVLLVR